jgi:hypothetical protein
MPLQCPSCRRVLEFLGEPPSFCGYCGRRLPHESVLETVSLPRTPPLSAGATQPSPPSGHEPPRAVGGYRLLQQLGEGGMGTVWEAEDAATGRRVAVKLITAGAAAPPDHVERFRQEGRLASRLAHPHCVFVLAADEEAGQPYIVMELMPGTTLQDLVKERGPLPPEEAVGKILDVIDGLQEAHRLGLIHRDMKPSNCFLDADGRVKVGDFGLAKSLLGDSHLTRTGAFLGTPLYVSPEQARADPVDHQTDVYSVAATLYYLLTGRAPHQTGDAAATLARIGSDPVAPLRTLRPELPAALDGAVLRGLERDRKRRWRDLGELRTALQPFVADPERPAALGLRLAAYALDWVLFLPGVLATVFFLKPPAFVAEVPLLRLFWKLWTVPWFLYFALLEGLWGCSLGKRLLDLRVRATEPGRPAGLRPVLLRTALFVGLVNVPFILAGRSLRRAGLPDGLLYPSMLLVYGLGVLLVLAPLRRRRGWRGLHELLSGTRVVALPEVRRAWTPAPRDAAHVLGRPAGLPERVGPFTVRGALCWSGGGGLVAADDPGLNRPVWLVLRPADARPLAEARREVTRPTRLRWLTSGYQGEWQWDAFQAPAGCPLLDLIAGEGRLTWSEAQPLLEQLAAEMRAACQEGTLPGPPTLAQVWVQPSGRVQLLDVPPDSSGGPPTYTADEGAAVVLLGETAILVLEGRPRPPAAAPRPPRVPLPGAAVRLLCRLPGLGPSPELQVEPFRAGLAALHEHPAEVRAAQRAGPLAVLALALLPGLVLMFLGPPLDRAWGLWQRQAEIDWTTVALELLADPKRCAALARELPADAPGQALLRAAATEGMPPEWLRQHQDQAEDAFGKHRIALTWLDEMLYKVLQWRGPPVVDDELSASQILAAALDRRPGGPSATVTPLQPVPLRDVLCVVAPPLLWGLWAFLTRGGFILQALGLSLVRSDGRPAMRGQCAARALLVWAPPTVLLLASLGVTAAAPGWDDLALCLQLLAAAVVGSYVFLALRSPARALHDRLAGTYLVPR